MIRFTATFDRLFNKYRLVRAYRLGQADTGAYPSVVNIESSSSCNLRCPMCTRDSVLKTGFMPLELYKRIIDEISRFTELAVLHNFGEPLMNPNLAEMVEYAGYRGTRSLFSTNGTLLSEEMATRLVKGGLDLIIIAVDAATRATYEKIRKGADFQRTEDNILALLSKKRSLQKKNPRIVLQFIEMECNKHEVPDFRRKWRNHDVQVFVKPSIAQDAKIGHVHGTPCDRLWFQSVILSNGFVLPCCMDDRALFALGDINQSMLSALWNSSSMQKIRNDNMLKPGESALCASCNYDPPRRHTLMTAAAQCIFDMGTLAHLLYRIGYTRKRQL